MAGSCGGIFDKEGWGFGGSQTCRSLISLPRNIIYSKISSLGGTGRSVGRSSVPNDLTGMKTNNLNYSFIWELLNKPFELHVFLYL